MINEVINFVQKYMKEIIIVAVIFLISVISAIITVKKTNGKVSFWDALRANLLGKLPFWINLVEEPGQGKEKRERVIELALDEAATFKGSELTELEKKAITSLASKFIEEVLATPHKKDEVVKKSKYR